MTVVESDYETAIREVKEAIGPPIVGGSIVEMIGDLKRQYEDAYQDALGDIKNAGRLAINIVQDIEPTDGNYTQLNEAIRKLKKAFGLDSGGDEFTL